MADDDDEPAVTLGDRTPVEGAPLARISARFMWGLEREAIIEREGESVIRTPDGPQELQTILAEVDEPYFSTRQEFEEAVEAVIGTGPIPTEGDDEADQGTDGESEAETETEAEDADAEEGGEGEVADEESEDADETEE